MDVRTNNPVDETEEMLIQGCIKWDRSAQNRLYNLFHAKMFAVCYRYSDSREEAEDTFQEGFMKVFENIKKFRHEGSLEGWIRRIMVNTALKKYKKKSKSFKTVSRDNPDFIERNSEEYHTDDILSRIDANEIMKLIDHLPPAYKIVFNLYEFEGMKHQEIAKQLGISEGTSKSNLSRAKAILQKAIIQNEVNLEKIAR